MNSSELWCFCTYISASEITAVVRLYVLFEYLYQNSCNRKINTLILVLISVKTVIKVKVTGGSISKAKGRAKKNSVDRIEVGGGKKSYIAIER